MAVYAAQYQINIKVPQLGEIYIAPHFTKLSPKAEDKDQACQRIAKNIFQTFIEKLLRVSKYYCIFGGVN